MKTGSYTIPDEAVPAASEEAFTFMGWSSSNEATVPEYKAGDTITVSEDTVLYAVWQKHTQLVRRMDRV